MSDFSKLAKQVLDLLELSGRALVEAHDRQRYAADVRDRTLVIRDYLQATEPERIDEEKLTSSSP